MWHLYFWIYYITSIWNKWKCERENQSLDSYLPEDYYDLNYNGRTKLSIFLIRYISCDPAPEKRHKAMLTIRLQTCAVQIEHPLLQTKYGLNTKEDFYALIMTY